MIRKQRVKLEARRRVVELAGRHRCQLACFDTFIFVLSLKLAPFKKLFGHRGQHGTLHERRGNAPHSLFLRVILIMAMGMQPTAVEITYQAVVRAGSDRLRPRSATRSASSSTSMVSSSLTSTPLSIPANCSEVELLIFAPFVLHTVSFAASTWASPFGHSP
jgi:hypothetical protein